MTKKIKMEKEAEKLTQQFYFNYGYTPERERFFAEVLPKFAEKIFKENMNIDTEVRSVIGAYKDKQLGGFNATYGWLYTWLFDFAAAVLGVDELELKSSVV